MMGEGGGASKEGQGTVIRHARIDSRYEGGRGWGWRGMNIMYFSSKFCCWDKLF